MREKFESLPVATLRELAKAQGIPRVSTMRKQQLVDALLEAETKQEAEKPAGKEAEKPAGKEQEKPAGKETEKAGGAEKESRQERKPREERAGRGTRNTQQRRGNTRGQQGQQSRQGGTQQPQQQNQSRQGGTQQSRQGSAQQRQQQPRQGSAQQSQPQPQQPRQGSVQQSQQQPQQPRQDSAQPGQPQQSQQMQQPQQGQPPAELAALDSGNYATGMLEIMQDGYGFLRSENYLPGESDVYVAPSQIRKFNLKTGDIITGNTRVKTQQEKYCALLYIRSINGFSPDAALRRRHFEDMTPIFPNERLRMERGPKEMAMRIVDLISPVGKGQRGMIVSPPKAGKTTLLKEMATSILKNCPSMHIIIMLIDERPEEVTDIREAIVGDNVEVLYSTFDELPEHHKRVSEMGIERAKRLVEYGQDVVILLDSITRLARAYNLTVQPSGRTLSGGLDPAALHMPKRFFGAARNMREGGSLTILATALVDTGSKMDDVVYEEFKGTGNMELVLDRKLSERRVFPAIDIQKSGTRREDLLLEEGEQEAVYFMRRALNGMRGEDAVENILNLFVHTRSNAELVNRIRMQKKV